MLHLRSGVYLVCVPECNRLVREEHVFQIRSHDQSAKSLLKCDNADMSVLSFCSNPRLSY